MTKYAGTTYLVTLGEPLWTPEDIREHLRLSDPSFDKMLKAVIASQCINHGCQFTGAVWAVARGEDVGDFFKRANKIGKLLQIGPSYLRNGVTYHDCEYRADPVKARKAFRAIINWCHEDEGIYRATRREDEASPIVRGADLSMRLEAAE